MLAQRENLQISYSGRGFWGASHFFGARDFKYCFLAEVALSRGGAPLLVLNGQGCSGDHDAAGEQWGRCAPYAEVLVGIKHH